MSTAAYESADELDPGGNTPAKASGAGLCAERYKSRVRQAACPLLSGRCDDRLLKLPLYAEAGVKWTWLVDPELRSVEVYESVDGRATQLTVARDDERIAPPPFEASLAVGGWWMKDG